MRLTFARQGHRRERVQFDYIEFERVRVGTEEVEVRTKEGQALQLSLVIPNNPSSKATATIGKRFVGQRVTEVAKAAAALGSVQEGCEIALFALKLHAKPIRMHVPPVDLGLTASFLSFVQDLAEIAKRFNTDFVLPPPENFTAEDEEAFHLLRAFATGRPIHLSEFAMSIVKSSENAELLPSTLPEVAAFRTQHESFVASLFGTRVEVGACAVQIDKARVKDLEQTISTFRQAQIGQDVRIVLRPLVPVRYELLAPPNTARER